MLKNLLNNKGNVAILVAGSMIVLLGFTALAVDIGLMVNRKAELQKACDAAALAGAQELPDDVSSADTVAKQYAADNDVTATTVTITDDDKKITVSASEQVDFFFARALGINNGNVSASATATVITANEVNSNAGLRPFGVSLHDSDGDGIPDDEDPDDDDDGMPDVLEDLNNDGILDEIEDLDDDNDGIPDDEEDLDNDGEPDISDDDIDGDGILNDEDDVNFVIGQVITLKCGTGGGYHGNFQLLSLDDRGGDIERQILDGADTPYEVNEKTPLDNNGDGVPDIEDDDSDDDGIKDAIWTEPGQSIGNVKTPILTLIDRCECEISNSDDIDDPFMHEESCSRFMTVPIIYSINVSGRKLTPIVGFARFFLISYNNSDKSITGVFIEDAVSGGSNDTTIDYGVKTVKLID